MVATATELLPATLAARLSGTQRQQLGETPRPGRLARLADALALDGTAALAALAGASGLQVVAEPVVAATPCRCCPPAWLMTSR